MCLRHWSSLSMKAHNFPGKTRRKEWSISLHWDRDCEQSPYFEHYERIFGHKHCSVEGINCSNRKQNLMRHLTLLSSNSGRNYHLSWYDHRSELYLNQRGNRGPDILHCSGQRRLLLPNPNWNLLKPHCKSQQLASGAYCFHTKGDLIIFSSLHFIILHLDVRIRRCP